MNFFLAQVEPLHPSFIEANWESIVALAGIVGGIIGGLLNRLIDFITNRKNKRFEDRLDQLSFVYKTQFPQLHLHRSKVIARCNGYIIRLKEMVNLFEMIPPAQEQRDAFEGVVAAYQKCLDHNAFYFSRETGRDLINLGNFLRRSGLTNAVIAQSEKEGNQQRATVFQEKARQARLDLERALDVITDEFQNLLGVEAISPQRHLWNALDHYGAMFFELRNGSDAMSLTHCRVSISREGRRIESLLKRDRDIFRRRLVRQIRDVLTEGEDIMLYMREHPEDVTEHSLALTSHEAMGRLIGNIRKIQSN